MSVILRNVQIPLFIKVETGSLQNIQKIIDEHHLHFQRPLILSEERILQLGGTDVVHALHDCAIRLFKTNSIEEGNRLAEEIREKHNDVLVSIGGGRVLDLGKYAATAAQINYISIPTTPSNDGICSPVSVLHNAEGKTESLRVNMPIGILVDTHMMMSAPLNNIKAGIGDLISNFSAIMDWQLAYKEGKEQMDDFAASISNSAAQLIYETCRDRTINLHNESFLEKLVHGLILSGIAMNIAGSSRPCSGAEHKISHAIDALFPQTSLHGLQVSFATIFTHFLRKEPSEHLISFFRSLKLPITHRDIGLNDEQFERVIELAPTTRSERYTILEKLQLTPKEIKTIIQQYHEFTA
ncbi:MAG TPA: iron-containing alcohol dehydrogenase family protein [Patescibacteria group bacterium]|nr:iron-containing alcohol dehydrogenase family protein [Patescibacteria group bacterium]